MIPSVGDMRGPLMCTMVEMPSGYARWENAANLKARHRFVRAPGAGFIRWEEVEDALGQIETDRPITQPSRLPAGMWIELRDTPAGGLASVVAVDEQGFERRHPPARARS